MFQIDKVPIDNWQKVEAGTKEIRPARLERALKSSKRLVLEACDRKYISNSKRLQPYGKVEQGCRECNEGEGPYLECEAFCKDIA